MYYSPSVQTVQYPRFVYLAFHPFAGPGSEPIIPDPVPNLVISSGSVRIPIRTRSLVRNLFPIPNLNSPPSDVGYV